MTPEEDFKLTPDMAIANLQELKHYVDNDSKQAINLAIKALRGYYSTRLCPIGGRTRPILKFFCSPSSFSIILKSGI